MGETSQKLEQALHESQANLSALIENIDGSIWSVDRDYRLLVGNLAFQHEIETLLGHPLAPGDSVLAPDEFEPIRSEWRGYYDRALRGDRFSVEIQRLLFKTKTYSEYRFHPIHAADGSVVGVVASGRDVTERRQAEEENRRLLASVQREKDRLTALLNSISDEVWFADAEKNLTLINPAVVGEFGSSVETGLPVEQIAASFEVYRPDGSPRPVDEAPPLRALRGEVVRNQEEIVRTPATGELRWREVSATPVRDASGTIVGSVAVVRDITERKQTEQELREAVAQAQAGQQLLEALLEYVPEGITIADAEGNLQQVSRFGEELLGQQFSGLDTPTAAGNAIYRPDGITLMPLDELPLMRAIRKGEIVKDAEIIRINSQGKPVSLLCNAGPIRDAAGRIVGGVTAWHNITERKQAEQERAEQALMLSNLNDAVIGTDLSYRINYWSQSAEKMYGYRREEIMGQYAGILQPVFFGMTSQEALSWLERTGELNVELTHTTQDGRKIIVGSRTQILYDDRGERKGTISINRDITARKQAEEALRETRDYLDNLLTYANAPIIVWDPGYRITRFNNAFEHLTGLKSEAVLGQSLDLLFPTNRKEESLEHIRRASTGEHWEVVEIPIQRADGTVRTVLWNSATLYAADGTTVVATIAQGQDITGRKQAEALLRESQEQLRSLVENLPSVVMRYDRQFRVVYLSPQAETVTGIPRERFLGKTNREVGMPEELCVLWEEAIDRVFRTGERYDLEFDFPSVQGSKAFRLRLAPERAADGSTRYVLGLSSDITDQKQAEQERERLLAQTRRDAETKADLLREVNHRVKNNLAAIVGLLYAHLDRAGASSSPEYRALVRELSQRVDGLSIVHGLLSQSLWSPVRLDELAERIISAVLQGETRGKVVVDIVPSPLLVSPDQAQPLALVLNELALNIDKHTV